MKAEDVQSGEKVEAILDSYQRDKGLLVSILQDTQAEYNYLPKEALMQISQGLDIPLSQIYGVATFFGPSEIMGGN